MVEFYLPQPEELWFKEAMLADGATMAYNHAYGGTIPFPRGRWAAWYDKWLVHHENKRFYRYLCADGAFVGEAAYHLDEARQIFLADVIVFAPYRGKGYGRAALMMLCAEARARGVKTLYDEIAADNSAAALFMACGFREVSRTDAEILLEKEL